MTRWRSIMQVAGTAVLLSSCAVIHRPPTTVSQLQQDAVIAARAESAVRDSVVARLVRRAERRGDGFVDVLMLSGGGQNGAFGAGFLRGWLARSESRMPQFDLVTGISTGALQAPYALLGTVAAVDTLGELYRQAQERVAPSIDWWSWLRRSGGLVNTKKFDRTLKETVDGDFSAQLLREFAVDREVVFGTTDYDLGIGRTWQLSASLDASDTGLLRTQSLLKAATSIPGIFPPVIVDGHVHGDGGVITNVLPLLRFDDYERLAKALQARGQMNVTVRVFVVMNMWMQPRPLAISPASRRAIESRSNQMLFYTHQPQTLELIEALSRAVTTGVPGLRVEFRVATLPNAQSMVPGADKLFDRTFIRHLDSLGFSKAQSNAPWDVVPSAYSRIP